MQIKSYLKYRKTRVNAHGIHSPFVYEFYNNVLQESKKIDVKKIIDLRKGLLTSKKIIQVEDFGAGSKKNKTNSRKVSELVKVAGVNKKFGKLLAKIVNFYKLENVIELGTSLGIGTSYLASQPSVKKLVTIEGSAEIAKLAKVNFDKLGLAHIEQIIGNFDDNLNQACSSFDKIDLVYIDGNHQYEATKRYFDYFIDKAHDETFLIFDDIYWSEGMAKAWNEIIKSDKINVSIDLFRMGIVCKRKAQAKQHFVLKF